MKVRHIVSIALLCVASNANAYSSYSYFTVADYKFNQPKLYSRQALGSQFCRYRDIPRPMVCRVHIQQTPPPVPVPPSIMLFISALMGLLSIFKLKKV